MADANDRVNLELVDAGDHKDKVLLVLSKVNGLAGTPEEIVNSAPCTIAENVPRHLAEKLQGFLEKAGAVLMIEGEEAEEDLEETLFTPDELPTLEEEEQETAGQGIAESSEESMELSADDWAFDDFSGVSDELSAEDIGGPSDDFGGFSAVDTKSIAESDENLLVEEEEGFAEDFGEDEGIEDLGEIEEEKTGGKFQSLLSKLPKKEKL